MSSKRGSTCITRLYQEISSLLDVFSCWTLAAPDEIDQQRGYSSLGQVAELDGLMYQQSYD